MLINHGTGHEGRFYWINGENFAAAKGIVAVVAWGSIAETQLEDYTQLYSSLHRTSLVCVAHFLNPVNPEKATSLAFTVLSELLKVLRSKPCGGSQACLYKIFHVNLLSLQHIINGECEVKLSLVRLAYSFSDSYFEESRLVRNCNAGHLYDSGPVDFTHDLGARFSLHQAILKVPGSAKLVSLVAKGITSGLDALFLTKFGTHRADYWRSLCSTVSFGAPSLLLCSESDDLAPYPNIFKFSQRLQDAGGAVKVVKWKSSSHVGHYKNYPIEYGASVEELLERSISVFSRKVQRLGEQTGADLEGTPDKISDLICHLQNAAVNSNRSLRRVAVGPDDLFFLPSSIKSGNCRDSQSSFTRG